MKLGTKAERFLAKHVHEIVARPGMYVGEERLSRLELYFHGMFAAFRAEHGRDPFADSPWNSWLTYMIRSRVGQAGPFSALESKYGQGALAFRKFLAYFNAYRKWAQGRSCTALLENAKSASAVRRFFRSKGAHVPRSRLAAKQWVTEGGRRFDAVIFRVAGWLEDDEDGRDNRIAIAIVDGMSEPPITGRIL
jgi:hypothetical protein